MRTPFESSNAILVNPIESAFTPVLSIIHIASGEKLLIDYFFLSCIHAFSIIKVLKNSLLEIFNSVFLYGTDKKFSRSQIWIILSLRLVCPDIYLSIY